ncbi:DNA-directed RNA polymerase III subunit RPC5 [Senna tora]|uniref:DNA-directed RNA polymerase III subunit RPC5 n=1 Tax=Senna tora TaxID=362788 RepID=A0A834WR77_9FABA|nr:DNA-directed RNA polymerase III subunit RPC5 [Senna tora]
MDLDDLDAPSKVPSRVSRFAPKSSKLKAKPKLEPQEPLPKAEAPESLTKPEPQDFDSLTAKQKEEEPSAPNGAMKMDVEPKSEAEDESKPDDPMDEDSAEDTVVREIDVFFTPSMDANTQLYVLQYPLRPCWRPYDLDDRCEEVRLKPESSEVEVDLSIDIESNNYDKEFASRLKMTNQTLSTSWKPPHVKGYAVGLLMGNKLHLHPIHAVVQLRPSLEHLNSGGSKRKTNVSTSSNATVKTEDSAEEKSVSSSKKQNKQVDSSIGLKSDGDEHWIPLKYHSSKSDISCRYLQQMVAQETSPINFTMTPYDYVTSLCPGVSNSILSKGPSRRYLLSLPPEERLKKLLVEGSPLHRFSAIKHFAPEYSEEELLGFLQQHALLVQGLWAPKGPLLYPQGGVESLARDFALLMFSKNLKVQLSHVNIRPELSKHIKNFLNIFGEEKIENWKSSVQPIVYWKFRENPDESFIKHYPNIAAKYKGIWEGMEERVYSAVYKAGRGEPGKNAVPKHIQNSKLGQSVTSDKRTSVGGIPPGRMTMTNDTRQALPIALKKLFQTHSVCSFQTICHGLREMALSKSMLSKSDAKIVRDAALGLDAPPEELQAVISEIACNIHGFYVLKSSQDDPFRDVVIDMLRGSGPNAKLRKAEIVEAARRKLKREVTNNEYNKVMGELCVSRGSVWILKTDDRIVQSKNL